jgi:hypothetical protein
MKVEQNQPDQATIPLQALSYLVAGNDILVLYEKMLNKREVIQSRRCRSDREVSVLFEKPFGAAELWPEYQQAQSDLNRLFSINEIFEA